jgi:DNA-binding transcriptional ArsR family regulator
MANQKSVSAKKKSNRKKELTPLALELIATRFRALSEPLRLRLVHFLMQDERNVGDLVVATGSSQANVSKHLAILRDAGMIVMEKRGLSTICRIADPFVYELCDLMCNRLRVEIGTKQQALPR